MPVFTALTLTRVCSSGPQVSVRHRSILGMVSGRGSPVHGCSVLSQRAMPGVRGPAGVLPAAAVDTEVASAAVQLVFALGTVALEVAYL